MGQVVHGGPSVGIMTGVLPVRIAAKQQTLAQSLPDYSLNI